MGTSEGGRPNPAAPPASGQRLGKSPPRGRGRREEKTKGVLLFVFDIPSLSAVPVAGAYKTSTV